MPKYKLRCLHTNEVIEDEYTLHHTDGALLVTEYSTQLSIDNSKDGMLKYQDWLPNIGLSQRNAGTTTYKANELGTQIGMNNLWVTFHGYWPEKDGMCPTGSFKDMEAVPTIMRLKEKGCKGMICASAGNTARAFAYFCGLENFPLIVIVGKDHAERLYLPANHPNKSVKLIVIEDGDYYDAKVFSKKISQHLDSWQMEGGIHNVARRDGIGSLIIDAAFAIGELPAHYFQGIGGGPGPVGVHEMANRLIEAELFEGPVPRQHVSQNEEHCPIHNAWQAKRPHLTDSDFPDEEVEVFSDYLLNKAPAYEIKGGVYDTLVESNGQTYIVSKEDAKKAKTIFESIEGIDIMSPAAVALASLMQALDSGDIGADDCTVLNISGGGIERMESDMELVQITPWKIVSKNDDALSIVQEL
jgi:cysteate synthase